MKPPKHIFVTVVGRNAETKVVKLDYVEGKTGSWYAATAEMKAAEKWGEQRWQAVGFRAS